MAQIVNTSYSGQFSLPIPIGRLNPTPIDTTAVWDTLVAAKNYAKNGATAWVGQLLFVKETNKYYKIDNTDGDLSEFGSGGSAQLTFATRYEFPTTGEENMLYIATDEKNSYIWDASVTGNEHYVLVSVDSRRVSDSGVIDGGGANSTYTN